MLWVFVVHQVPLLVEEWIFYAQTLGNILCRSFWRRSDRWWRSLNTLARLLSRQMSYRRHCTRPTGYRRISGSTTELFVPLENIVLADRSAIQLPFGYHCSSQPKIFEFSDRLYDIDFK